MTAPAPGFPDLERMLHPSGIAVLGASADTAKIGGRVVPALLRLRYAGNVYPIHATLEEIGGLPCYRGPGELPETPDLAIVALPAALVPAAIADCGRAGIPFAIVFSGGFGEIGPEGRELERQLVEAAREHGVRVCGPNTVGVLSAPDRVVATFASSMERYDDLPRGEAALVSQSGAVAAFLYSLGREEGFGLNHVIAVGNESDLTIADFVGALAADEETGAIGVYMEGLQDGRKLLDAFATALDAGKPVGVLKTGRSSAGQRAVESHTGALAGEDRVFDGVFEQAGVFRADGPDELLQFMRLAAQLPPLDDANGVGIVTSSGGLGAWAADKLSELGIGLARLTDATKEQLGELLPAFGSTENPVDLTGQILRDPGMVADCVDRVIDDPRVTTLLVVIGYQEVHGPELARRMVAARRRTGKLVGVTWILGPQAAYAELEAAGIPAFSDVGRCVRCLAGPIVSAVARGRRCSGAWRREAAANGRLGSPGLPGAAGSVIPEHEAKALLAQAGLRVPRGELARSSSEAVEIAARVGFPVALKGQVESVVHKSASGLVALGVADALVVEAAYEDIVRAAAGAGGGALHGVLVEEMAAKGVEVILGVTRDSSFGPVVMFGAGGVLVELTQDVVFRAPPISVEEAHRMIAETGVERLLGGNGGPPTGDRDALAEAIMVVAGLGWDLRDELEEIEVNPLIVHADGGVTAVDAVMVRRDG